MILKRFRHPFRKPPPAKVNPSPTFCAHRLHCQECHQQNVVFAQGWAAKLSAIEHAAKEEIRALTELAERRRTRLQECHQQIARLESRLSGSSGGEKED